MFAGHLERKERYITFLYLSRGKERKKGVMISAFPDRGRTPKKRLGY